ncbi:MAG: exodeoxyribonuclease VII small subunit [Syntrophomonadaceae bacterium]
MAEVSFDRALERLEEIVELLETGQLELEQSLVLFEEGVKLSVFCQKELRKTDGKVQRLIKKLDGSLEVTDLEE